MSAMKASGAAVMVAGDEGVDLAFEHLGQMASLLHAAGFREIAALMNGIWDVHQLSHRPARAGDDGEMLSYVFGQLADLADFMDEQGRRDAAMLLRTPAKFHALRQDMVSAEPQFRAQA